MKSKRPKAKNVSASAIEAYPHIVTKDELNRDNTLHGGKLVVLMDEAAGKVVFSHTGTFCRTRWIDGIGFCQPIYLGELIILKASLNRVWNTSAEVGVKAFVQDPKTGSFRHVASGYFVMVALCEHHLRVIMPKVVARTKVERRRYLEAEERRKRRLESERKEARSEPTPICPTCNQNQ